MNKLLISSFSLTSALAFCADPCIPENGVCNKVEFECYYCMGPSNMHGNAPVRPWTCNGDLQLSASLLYWSATQDGMEYGLQNNTRLTEDSDVSLLFGAVVDGEFLKPKSEYHLGYNFGLSYFSPCDGWEVGASWTQFNARGSSHEDVSLNKRIANVQGGMLSDVPNAPDGEYLDIFWSAFSGVFGQKELFCSEANTSWKAPIYLLDFDLAREFWVSKRLSLRPMVGVRASQIRQKYILEFLGGVWGSSDLVFTSGSSVTLTNQPPYVGEVTLRNNFEGVGPRSGIGLNWNLSCGFSLYNNVAASILYGRFNVKNHETFREAETPFSRSDAADLEESFHASRGVLDLDFGLQWSGLICDCKYGITALLAWESHLFFHQNQMWRIKRTGVSNAIVLAPPTTFPDNIGENGHYQRKGTLSTQGLTFTFKFDF